MDMLTPCQQFIETIDPSFALPVTLFLVAFFGGFAHCTLMCGPFVMVQQMKRMENLPIAEMTEFKRLQGALLLPYHLGRLTTYTFLGMVSYFLGVFLTKASMMPIMVWFMIMAGVLIFLSLFKIPFLPNIRLPKLVINTIKPFSEKPFGWRGYVYGLVLGFLPCGMLYGAFAAVAGAESLSVAILSMISFSVGTMPGLFLVGILSQLGGNMLIKRMKLFARVGLAVAAFWLIGFGILKLNHMQHMEQSNSSGHMAHAQQSRHHH